MKFINDLEINKSEEAELDGKSYTYIIDEPYRWDVWAAPVILPFSNPSKSSNHILKGVISQAFYEVKNAKDVRVEVSKEYIVRYKNDESAAWHIHFAIKNFKGLKLIENDIEFIKNLAKSKFTLKESYDFWDYLKNEFYNNKRLSGQILEIIDIFIEAHSSSKEDSYDYRSKERIEFLMELYSRFDDEYDKERCLEIIDKFLMNDQYRNSIQSYLEDN